MAKLSKEPSYYRNGPSIERGTAYRLKTATYDAHRKLTEELFFEQHGDGQKIFREYDALPDNLLMKPSSNDNSFFHTMLDCVENMITSEEMYELMRVVPSTAREFLQCLVIKYPEILTKVNQHGDRPLDMAAAKVKPIVFLIADLLFTPDNALSLPTKTCVARLKARPTDVCRFELPGCMKHMFPRNQASGSSTCAHNTVDVEEVERWNSKFKDIITQAMRPLSKNSGRVNSGTILHVLLDEVCFTKTANDGSDMRAASFQRLIELCDEETLLSTDSQGLYPLHKAIQLYQANGVDFERLSNVIRSLVQQCPSAIYRSTDETSSNTPYSMLRDISRPEQKEGSTLLLETLKFLKHTCIGADDPDRDRKLIHLYGNLKNVVGLLISICETKIAIRNFLSDTGHKILTMKLAKNIYLDLAFPHVIDKNFVSGISTTVKFNFDTALEYVSLRRDNNPSTGNASGQERNPYEGVFEWLLDHGVEKIFGIVVEDLVPLPHTDESIRMALKPFHVEKWDWRKLDICSQTIIEAAPETRELCLQSSGNNAVLRSWACKHGLGKLQYLKSVTITMHHGLRETKEECKRHFESFKTAFCRRRPDLKPNIHLKWAGEPSIEKDDTNKLESLPGSHQSDQVAWTRKMRPFIRFMDSIKNNLEDKQIPELDSKVEVRIALIDNGVYSRAEHIPILAKGNSWHGQRLEGALFRDFFTGPSRHGTQMAQCIYKVCPMAQLYVARMDDSSREKFTVDSAIKAILWATAMDVDIISMSWTFMLKDASTDQQNSFKEAIQKASNAGIILFNSLNDKEMTSLSDWYPSSLPEVIRVGSATKWGEKAEPNKPKAANYLFPGEKIALRAPADTTGINNLETRQDEFVSGSSLATAFAAGLAGLIIYSSRVLAYMDPEMGGNKLKQLKEVASRSKIEHAFKVLSGVSPETIATDLFVELGSYFPGNPEGEAVVEGKTYVLNSLFTKLLLL